MVAMDTLTSLRIDKWLWCTRFYKTRGLAADEIAKGRVTVNGLEVKASREVHPGDTVVLRQGFLQRTVVVQALSAMRGPAPIAQQLYEETAESIAQREKAQEMRRLAPEPAATLQEGRPTKRDRREIERAHDWGSRWSASVDD